MPSRLLWVDPVRLALGLWLGLTLAVVVTPSAPPPGGVSDPANQGLITLAEQLNTAGLGTVAAGSASASGPGSAIDALRVSAAAGQISTVDNADTVIGQIVTVQALAKALAGGKASSYGWQPGLPTHYDVSFDPLRLDLDALLAPDILPTFSAERFGDLGAVLDTPGREHAGKLALIELQNGDNPPEYVAGTENFYFLADYHALIKCDEPARIQRSTLEIAACWLAAGLDPEQVFFYRQSDSRGHLSG